MAKIKKEIIDKIRGQDIIQVAGQYFTLQKDGKNYAASCKHGSDTTPSLVFYPESNSFYCFGCGAGSKEESNGSDIIAFTQWAGEMEFSEAIHHLCDIFNIQPEYEQSNVDAGKSKKYEALMNQSRLYWKHLQTNPQALEYLHNRGISDEEIAKWRIGLVPDTEDGAYKNRIAFSIMDRYNQTVGFSYRDMNGILNNNASNGPKYINSSNDDIFNKSAVLYGYSTAREKDNSYIVLGEGFGDAIIAQKLGLPFVSLMGTSLSNYHVSMLSANYKNIIIWMDGDAPGRKAMMRHADVLRAAGMVVRGITYPGMDPDDVLLEIDNMTINQKEKESKALEIIRKESKLVSHMQVEQTLNLHDSRMNELKLHAVGEIKPIVAGVNDREERNFLKTMVAKRLNVTPEDIEWTKK